MDNIVQRVQKRYREVESCCLRLTIQSRAIFTGMESLEVSHELRSRVLVIEFGRMHRLLIRHLPQVDDFPPNRSRDHFEYVLSENSGRKQEQRSSVAGRMASWTRGACNGWLSNQDDPRPNRGARSSCGIVAPRPVRRGTNTSLNCFSTPTFK